MKNSMKQVLVGVALLSGLAHAGANVATRAGCPTRIKQHLNLLTPQLQINDTAGLLTLRDWVFATPEELLPYAGQLSLRNSDGDMVDAVTEDWCEPGGRGFFHRSFYGQSAQRMRVGIRLFRAGRVGDYTLVVKTHDEGYGHGKPLQIGVLGYGHTVPPVQVAYDTPSEFVRVRKETLTFTTREGVVEINVTIPETRTLPQGEWKSNPSIPGEVVVEVGGKKTFVTHFNQWLGFTRGRRALR